MARSQVHEHTGVPARTTTGLFVQLIFGACVLPSRRREHSTEQALARPGPFARRVPHTNGEAGNQRTCRAGFSCYLDESEIQKRRLGDSNILPPQFIHECLLASLLERWLVFYRAPLPVLHEMKHSDLHACPDEEQRDGCLHRHGAGSDPGV
jgi:hypothetical protein